MLFIYGAYGYTGELVSRRAVELGMKPILSGRNAERLAGLSRSLGLEQRPVALDDSSALRRALRGVSTVLHCAGPFVRTSAPMIDACLAAGVHYLDITGEIDVFEAAAGRDRAARDAKVTVLPGAGFDVVPSDCLALHLKRRLPSATRLTLGLRSGGRLSHGTATTMLEHAERGCVVRRSGELVALPLGSVRRSIDFGRGPVPAVAIAWGDVASAWRSTGIPDIEVFASLPKKLGRVVPWLMPLAGLARLGPVRRALQRHIDRRGPGPSAGERSRSSCTLWGAAEDDDGRRVEARVHTPDGYTLTAQAALHLAAKVQRGEAPVGYQTPASAFGPDLVLELDGVSREELG